MASFDDDADPANNSNDEFEDEEMEDANDNEQDNDNDQDQGGDDDNDNDDEDDNDDNDDDDDDDDNERESPSQRASQHNNANQRSDSRDRDRARNPDVVLTSPSPRASAGRSPGTGDVSWYPQVKPEALTAQAYDIVPTMAAPMGTSINAVAATPDMRWVFTGGTDGYVRMFNWVETANGKVPLTVAQKHPFVDSVMKAGSLLTYWENEEPQLKTPPMQADEGKWTSPVYSLAVQHQAIWLLSGLESGGINLQTCRHQAGTRITTLKEHTSAVSVLNLARDETSVLSGSWDKSIHDWDLHTGQIKRSFIGSGMQISAIETRPQSDLSVPEVAEVSFGSANDNDTFSSNDHVKTNGLFGGNDDSASKAGDEDALGSPSGSLFGENDHGSLFGEDNIGGGGNAFGEDDDELTRELANGLLEADADAPTDAPAEQEAPAEPSAPVEPEVSAEQPAEQDAAASQEDTEMSGMGSGGPVQPPEPAEGEAAANEEGEEARKREGSNGLPHSDEPLTAPPTNEDDKTQGASEELPAQSESVFMNASIDGTLRIWDRRIQSPVATIQTYGSTPPWCTGACWSPDGNFFYAGRRNCTVDEYSIHHLGSKRSEPNRTFKFQPGSGPVYAVRAMPNKRHLVCASNDILRIYDLSQSEASRHRTVPFTIVPGHRGGVISAIHVDPSCRFMLSAAGNRGWEGAGTEVLLGYEIGMQDPSGQWHK